MRNSYLWLSARILVTVGTMGMLAMVFINSGDAKSIPILFISAIVFVVSGVYSIRLGFNGDRIKSLLRAEIIENRFEPLHLLSQPVIFIFSFAVLSFQIHTFDIGGFIVGPPENYTHNLEAQAWIMFSLDHAFRAIFLDAFETYHISISNIQYTNLFLIESYVFIYKTVLAICFWRFVYNLYKHWNWAISDSSKI